MYTFVSCQYVLKLVLNFLRSFFSNKLNPGELEIDWKDVTVYEDLDNFVLCLYFLLVFALKLKVFYEKPLQLIITPYVVANNSR